MKQIIFRLILLFIIIIFHRSFKKIYLFFGVFPWNSESEMNVVGKFPFVFILRMKESEPSEVRVTFASKNFADIRKIDQK